jgi:hypothetical protein
MKLIICANCQDILKLQNTKRTCLCGQSWGQYDEDNLNATIGGYSIPLGIDNTTLTEAITHRNNSGPGTRFEAFVISESCEHITQKGTIPRIIKRLSPVHICSLLQAHKY